ncbi:MAG: hypothetical protein WDM88_03975 [Galbitalea sp.]
MLKLGDHRFHLRRFRPGAAELVCHRGSPAAFWIECLTRPVLPAGHRYRGQGDQRLGGIGGKKLIVKYADNQLEAAASVTAMNQLTSTDGAKAVVMTSSAGVYRDGADRHQGRCAPVESRR